MLPPTRSTGTPILSIRVTSRLACVGRFSYLMCRPPLSRPFPPPQHHEGQTPSRVQMAVRNAAPEEDRHVIEKGPVPVRRLPELRHVPGEKLDVIPVDLRHVGDHLRDLPVVGQGMPRLRDADLRIGAGVLLLSHHERDHPCQVGLESQELQVEHQLQVVLELVRDALGLLHERQFHVELRLRNLDAPFDVPNGLRVLVDFELVLGPDIPLEVAQLLRDRVQDALLLLHTLGPWPPAPCSRNHRTSARTPTGAGTPWGAAGWESARRSYGCTCSSARPRTLLLWPDGPTTSPGKPPESPSRAPWPEVGPWRSPPGAPYRHSRLGWCR